MSTKRTRKTAQKEAPLNKVNGAVASTPKKAVKKATTEGQNRETHGGFTPNSGPITNVQQLLGKTGRNVIKGSVGYYATAEDYEKYLRTLSEGDLHLHAINEAHIVAIDNREKLIKRLIIEYSGIKASESANANIKPTPAPIPVTDEQRKSFQDIRDQLLNGKTTR